MDLDLTGDIALVTAGSSGLGLTSATALAREGADVAICARNAGRLETARTAVDDAGPGDVLAVQTDLTDPDELDDLLDAVTTDFGGLDHVVVSTGVPPCKPFAEALERDWYVTYDLFVMSLVWLSRRAYPHLVASDAGSVTVVAGTEARDVNVEDAPSSVLRRAVLGLVETLALSWAPEVRVNAVLPGPHATPSLDRRLREGVERGRYDSVTAGREAVQSGIPLRRLGDPDDFGALVAFLASEYAGFVTGSAVPVDGGLLRR